MTTWIASERVSNCLVCNAISCAREVQGLFFRKSFVGGHEQNDLN